MSKSLLAISACLSHGRRLGGRLRGAAEFGNRGGRYMSRYHLSKLLLHPLKHKARGNVRIEPL